MKRNLAWKTALSVTAGFLTFASIGIGQDSKNPDGRIRSPAQQQVQERDALRAGNLDNRTMGSNIRASQLMGMNIENSARDGVGKINDIVLNAKTGKINYVAVTYGGFLGIGNDMHAVPFEAFKFMQDPDDPDETILVLNVTQEQMAGAKGFDENTWPNFADRKFILDLDRRYGIDRTQTRYDRTPQPGKDDNSGHDGNHDGG